VRDGYRLINGTHGGEAGQHGFWDNYFNIYELLKSLPTILSIDDVLTGYAEQGQYSPRGLEAVWPVFRLAGGGGRVAAHGTRPGNVHKIPQPPCP
jgi:hypothetical protein